MYKLKIQSSAILAGVFAFVMIYAIGGMIIVFSMSLFSDILESDSLTLILRVGGFLALAFPAYVSARVVDENGLLHALVMGVIEGVGIVILMTFTFSFEGTMQQYVLSRMLPVFCAVLAICLVGGAVAEWIKTKSYT